MATHHRYHKTIKQKGKTKRIMMKQEFKNLNQALTEIVDHLEDELEHVRAVNAVNTINAEMETEHVSISSTESVSINHRENALRRPSQIKFAYQKVIKRMQKMKESQHQNHTIIKQLREKISKQAQTISDLPSEQEIKRLLQQIKKLLYEISEYILFQDIQVSTSIQPTNNRYGKSKKVKKVIEQTTKTHHQRSPQRSTPKSITRYNYYEDYQSSSEEIENLKSVLKETKVSLEEMDDIHFEDNIDSNNKQKRRSEWRNSVNALQLRQEEVIPKSVHIEQINSLTERNKMLQDRIEKFERDINDQKIKYESDIITKIEIIETITKELEGTENDLDSMESKYEKLSIKYKHICHEFDAAIQEFNKGNDTLLSRNKSLKIKLEQSISRQINEIKEKDELLLKIQTLQKEKGLLRRHCMEYSKIYQEIEVKNEIIEEYHADTINNVNDEKTEILKLRQRIDELTKELEDIHKTEQQQQSKESTEILMRQSNVKIAELKESEIQQLKQENQTLRSIKEKLKIHNKELQQYLDDKSQALIKAKSDIIELEQKMKLKESNESINEIATKNKRNSLGLNQAFYKWQMDLTQQLNKCSKDNDDSMQDYDKELQQIQETQDAISILIKKPILKKKRNKK